jgi:hypothetical protein
MIKFTLPLLAVAFAAAAVPAFAADLPQGVVSVPAPPAAALLNTLSFETSPEFYALATSSHTSGQLADWYGKLGYSLNLGSGFSGSLAVQDTFKVSGAPINLTQQQYEAALAYKLSAGGGVSFTVSALLGYTAGNTGYVGGKASGGALVDLGNSDDGYLYYAISGAVDWKVDSHWTWNVVNVRYRNAFDRTWLTPKVATGVTYAIDSADSVYANVGYGWKDTGNGAGLLADKFNVAVGYKYSF